MFKPLLSAAAALLLVMPVGTAAQDALVPSLEGLYNVTKQNVMATAELLDEELYAFRPTDEVRTVGQLLAHIANAQLFFCSTAAGEQSPATEDFEETRTTKEAITAALEESFAYCDGIFAAATDESLSGAATLFGQPNTMAGVLAFNSAHNFEHYGNLVTYMRINGIVPPSSRGMQ